MLGGGVRGGGVRGVGVSRASAAYAKRSSSRPMYSMLSARSLHLGVMARSGVRSVAALVAGPWNMDSWTDGWREGYDWGGLLTYCYTADPAAFPLTFKEPNGH